jgi:hypothetical protein
MTLFFLLAGCGTTLPWPNSSYHAVIALPHPSLDKHIDSLDFQLQTGFRFVVMGDQQVLADGEWQSLLEHVAKLDTLPEEPPLLFILDTGDIVSQGQYSDQFRVLQDILNPVSHLPYLVAVGNHEVDKNREGPARDHLTRFLTGIDANFGPDRMYYRKDMGNIRLIALDTNDFVYGSPTHVSDPNEPVKGPRADVQLQWLMEQLAQDDPDVTTIVALHHPFLHSSKIHREAARHMWSLEYNGRSLPTILADGGVDIVITGHTHTYERFTLIRSRDGHKMAVINISGRPRTSFLFFGAGRRRCRDIRGKEHQWLSDKGWENLDDWEIRQEETMSEDERDQFGLFNVHPDGRVTLQMHYLTEQKASPLRATEAVYVP